MTKTPTTTTGNAGVPADVAAAIRASILGYLHGRPGTPHALTKVTGVTTHGGMCGDAFISCLVGHQSLPAGTPGWLFVSDKHEFEKWTMIGDEWKPVPGTPVYLVGRYYTWVTLIDIDGHTVLADAFEYVALPEKKLAYIA